jgi:hypothetical protein
MPLPLQPSPDRPHAWQQGRSLPLGEREKRWLIDGFADYEVDEAGRMWHRAHADAAGHRRRGREVKRQRKKAGSEGYQLRRRGCPVWLSVSALRKLLKLERETI